MLHASFFSHLLENASVEATFFYALLSHYKGAKWSTVGVTKEINDRLPHHRGFMLAYLMENETSLVHHIIKW